MTPAGDSVKLAYGLQLDCDDRIQTWYNYEIAVRSRSDLRVVEAYDGVPIANKSPWFYLTLWCDRLCPLRSQSSLQAAITNHINLSCNKIHPGVIARFCLEDNHVIESVGSRLFDQLLVEEGAVAALWIISVSKYDSYCQPISHVPASTTALKATAIAFWDVVHEFMRSSMLCYPDNMVERQ